MWTCQKKIEKKFERNIPSLARVVVRISIPDYDKRFLLFNVNFQLTEWIPKVMMQRQQTRKIQAWLNSLTIQYWRYKKKSHPRPKYSILCKQKVNIFGLPTTSLLVGSIGRYVNMPKKIGEKVWKEHCFPGTSGGKEIHPWLW